MPDVDERLKRELELGRTEGGKSLNRAILEPALNVRGLQGGAVGKDASNTIPTEARASIDFRLVPDQRPEKIKRLTEDFLRSRGWTVVDSDPSRPVRSARSRVLKAEWTLDYPGYRSNVATPEVRAITQAMTRALGQPVVQSVSLGGSVPMAEISGILNVPIVKFLFRQL